VPSRRSGIFVPIPQQMSRTQRHEQVWPPPDQTRRSRPGQGAASPESTLTPPAPAPMTTPMTGVFLARRSGIRNRIRPDGRPQYPAPGNPAAV
jgi:hypothetical protein